MKRYLKHAGRVALAIAAGGALAWAFWPRPVPVDVAAAFRGPLQQTVDEDGKTRIRERYVISAALEGRLMRIEWHPGDKVAAGQSLLATIEPNVPAMLDERQLAQAEARVRAAEAAREQANVRIEHAHEADELAAHDYTRAKELLPNKAISREAFDRAEHQARMASQDLRAAELAAQVAAFDLQQAQAALLRSRPSTESAAAEGRFDIRSPIDGVVLRVFQESARVVKEGEALLELGDPRDLELEIDVLSADGARIMPGAKVLLEHWGGDRPLAARVRLVEPAAFLKISALGVEEQRVNVIADFTDPPEKRAALGDAFRVEARIVTWERDDVLKAPAGALFRKGDGWAAFVVRNGHAELRSVQIGHGNGLETEVLGGLEAGDQAILHPSDRISDGVAVSATR